MGSFPEMENDPKKFLIALCIRYWVTFRLNAHPPWLICIGHFYLPTYHLCVKSVQVEEN